jgi:hypothetical protein
MIWMTGTTMTGTVTDTITIMALTTTPTTPGIIIITLIAAVIPIIFILVTAVQKLPWENQ